MQLLCISILSWINPSKKTWQTDQPCLRYVVVMLSSYWITIPVPHRPAYISSSSRITMSSDSRTWSILCAVEANSESEMLKLMVDEEPTSVLYPRWHLDSYW
ncbi:hypothetical protein Ancab_033645 [Ancistrocladus abbreviatus]